jgi:hypothetical protein
MQKPFDLQGSSLGIIKGANLYIDFSTVDKYDESLQKLIVEITHTETELNISPRKFCFSRKFCQEITHSSMNSRFKNVVRKSQIMKCFYCIRNNIEQISANLKIRLILL